MLFCGCINPPPITDPDYSGVYFSEKDDMRGQAAKMGGTPLLVEHNTQQVGTIVSAWIGPNGSMYALAEIDTKKPGGAVAAAYMKNKRLRQLSMGYTQKMSSQFKPLSKVIREVSLVEKGARPGCFVSNMAE